LQNEPKASPDLFNAIIASLYKIFNLLSPICLNFTEKYIS